MEQEPCKIEVQPWANAEKYDCKVDCEENGIKLDAEGTNQDGTPMPVEYSAKFDGKDYPITGTYARYGVGEAYRRQHDTVHYKKERWPVNVHCDKVTVSADGKTRTSTFKGTDGQGHDINNIVVYDKQ